MNISHKKINQFTPNEPEFHGLHFSDVAKIRIMLYLYLDTIISFQQLCTHIDSPTHMYYICLWQSDVHQDVINRSWFTNRKQQPYIRRVCMHTSVRFANLFFKQHKIVRLLASSRGGGDVGGVPTHPSEINDIYNLDYLIQERSFASLASEPQIAYIQEALS